jgi:hypothetical protein
MTLGGTVDRPYRERFAHAEKLLNEAGFDTLNPARHPDDPSKSWRDWMALGIADVLAAGGVATLEDWWLSRGARLEVMIAASLDMPVRPVAEWLP